VYRTWSLQFLMQSPADLIRITLEGCFAIATQRNARPHGMTPLYRLLKDEEIVDALTHIRSSWGNRAAEVTALDMANYRNGVLRAR
jgi:hypothetical protein